MTRHHAQLLLLGAAVFSRRDARQINLLKGQIESGVAWSPTPEGADARHKLRQWVDDLRSGRFQQCRGKLALRANGTRDIVGFCCLGVYAYRIDGVSTEALSPAIFLRGADMGDDNTPADDESRVDSSFPLGFEVQNALSILNDSQEFSFNEIADVVEAVWLTPFGA